MPADIAGGLGAVALFAAPGYGLTTLLPDLRRTPAARRAAYAYLLGVAWMAGLLYALSHFLAVPLRPPAVWTLAAVPLLAATAAALPRWLRRRRRPDPKTPPARQSQHATTPASTGWAARLRRIGGPVGAVALAIAAVICVAVFAEAVSDPVNDWDGRMTWSAQARFLRQAGTVDAPVLRQPQWFITHPQYPLLLPIAQVAVREAFHADPDAPFPRALYAAFLPAFLLILYDGARRAGGPLAAALVTLSIALTPYMLLGAGAAPTTYSDLPLATFYGAALVLLLAPRPTAGRALAAGLLLAAAILTKNEGLLLALLALALGWRTAARPRHSKTSAQPEPQAPPAGVSSPHGAEFQPTAAAPMTAGAGTPLTAALATHRADAPPPTDSSPTHRGDARPPTTLTIHDANARPPAAGSTTHGTDTLPPTTASTIPADAAPPPFPQDSASRHHPAAGASTLPPHLLRFLATALPILAAVALLASWRAGIVNRQDDAYPQLLRVTHLWPGVVTQPISFAPVLLSTMFRFDHWARFWWMVPAILLAGRRALRHPRHRRLLLAAAAPLAIAWAAYTIHPQPAQLAAVTWNRILLEASIPLLIVLAGALATVLRAWRRLIRRRLGRAGRTW